MMHRTLFARRYRCLAPGYWVSDDGFVLREEMRGDRNAHQWFVFQVSPERAAQPECPEPHESILDLGPTLSFFEAARVVWQASPAPYAATAIDHAEMETLRRVSEQRSVTRRQALRLIELQCLLGEVRA